MAENLFAYTAVNSSYSQGTAGAIYGERNAAASALTAVKNKISIPPLNGDPAFFNFFDRNTSRLVLRQYNYSTTDLKENRIIDPQGNWAAPLHSQIWTGVANLHGVASKGKWLFGTGYDLAKISVINMDDQYKQEHEYAFPTDFPDFRHPYLNATYHGEALTVGTDGYLYALFYVNQGSGYENYYNSIVAQFSIDSESGELSFEDYVTVGKNSFTLDLYDNKLYVCSLGGMQNAGSGNADTNLCIVDLNNFTQDNVTTVQIANPTQKGDFRDISIVNENHVYIFLGHYTAGFSGFTASVYHTSLSNITSPATWTEIISLNASGYLWGIYADGSRLWFIQGTPIAIYNGTPSTAVSADKTFHILDMSDYDGGHLNSACFIAPSLPMLFGVRMSVSSKSLASHIRLAKEARELAEKLKKKE
ncbi:hypothetical protein [Fusobacterium necrophorum]|uniref:hypothetical protein n=1 Tax=Fusobacterium necrophorum TaxID=859 RepID=UPI000245DDC6|nr:hypothetical protein [Fusobacterium necrophorum]AVQ21302.1 hypothetical protein C4N15_06480 [Fusobacterium necrophorum subsp. funduliforme]EHO19870.1 hypothetical protein HMPREF9466_01801 [Fusobacterium necrophorum subsp. funduliforme 1_1_36S]